MCKFIKIPNGKDNLYVNASQIVKIVSTGSSSCEIFLSSISRIDSLSNPKGSLTETESRVFHEVIVDNVNPASYYLDQIQ